MSKSGRPKLTLSKSTLRNLSRKGLEAAGNGYLATPYWAIVFSNQCQVNIFSQASDCPLVTHCCP